MRLVLRHRTPIRRWMTDRQDRVRVGVGYEGGVVSAIVLDLESGKWNQFWSYEQMREPGTEIMGFGIDPSTLYVRAAHEGRNAIFTLDLDEPGFPRTLLAHDPDYDIDGALIHSPLSRDVIGVYHSGADGARIYWNESYRAFQEMIDEALPDTTNFLIDFSTDERRYIVYAVSDVNPGEFYYGDRDEEILFRFGSAYPELENSTLSGKRPITYKASDGIEIEGYLTHPWGQAPKPWPAVVLPHGGPESRDYATFDYMTEFLASRGYAVLQMNFRGSSGYGWDFRSAAHQDLGGRMQDDVTDGARWLVQQGIADPRRMCIMGASYGGYAALWGAVKTPDLFRCAISLNGVSDWAKVLDQGRYAYNRESIRQQLGKRGDLKQVSPLRRAAEIRVPVLLVHGEKDRIVSVHHSRKMARQLGKLGKVHRYVELENGVHALTNASNRTTCLKEVEAFLAEHL
jgi:dipeptidyl aminopeptidase/acylaminoacyl peptidase